MTHMPDSGKNTVTISPEEKSAVKEQIRRYGSERYGHIHGLISIDVRFRGQYGYIESYHEPFEPVRACSQKSREKSKDTREKLRNTPSPLCRLTYISRNRWTLSIYNFCKDIYEPSLFLTGQQEGTVEEGLDTAMLFFYPDS